MATYKKELDFYYHTVMQNHRPQMILIKSNNSPNISPEELAFIRGYIQSVAFFDNLYYEMSQKRSLKQLRSRL